MTTRKLTLFALAGAMLIAPVAFSDCTPRSFDVTAGCAYGSSPAIPAVPDGNTDARPAIQQCLLAAGDFYKECREASTPEQPVEVTFGAGTYFVSGAFRSQLVEQSVAHWIALVLPRGVAMRGVGMTGVGPVTTITIRKTPDERPVGGTGPRAGTFLIAAGVEKLTKLDPVTRGMADHYCDEDLPATNYPGPAGHPRPLCGGTQAELEKGGAYNAIYDMRLLGDSFAMVKHLDGQGSFAAESAAVYVADGYKFKMARVRVEEWYRGVYLAVNGADIRDSQFVNNYKAGLYIAGIGTAREGGREPRYIHDPSAPQSGYGQQPYDVVLNWLGNEEPWLANMDLWSDEQGAAWDPFWSLAGFLFTGNNSTCGNINFHTNRVYRARVIIDPPCYQQVVLTNNWISLSGMAITIGGGSANFEEPGGLQSAKAILTGNSIDNSLSGIAIQGCNFLGYEKAELCMHRTVDQVVIDNNELTAFRAYRSPGSDPYVDRMARWVGTGSVFAGISIADINGVTITGNKIRDLKRGTQMAGIFTHTSFHNVRTVERGFTQPINCYMPFHYNTNVQASSNEIRYSPDPKTNGAIGFVPTGLGFFTENTLNFSVDGAAAAMDVDAHRTINTQIASLGAGIAAQHCYSDFGSTVCPRAMLNGEHNMSTLRQAARAGNPAHPLYYCSQQTKEQDQEFNKHTLDR